MRRPSSLIVLCLMCAAALRSCVAVKFETLQELLGYHEQQQNPDYETTDEMVEEEFLSSVTTPAMVTHESPDVLPQGHHHSHLVEEGSGLEFDETAVLTTTPAATTALVQETQEPTTTRRITTCCRLGEEAGRKRHHCNPDNYLPRLLRDQQRGHNFKQTNKHPSKSRTQFNKCVSGVIRRLSDEFRTCCEEAYKRMWQTERGEDVHQGDRTHLLEIPF